MDTKFDIVVIGAGAAGMSAALAAARHNKKVLLIEKYGFLGGTATMGLVHHWDPLKLMEISGIILEVYDLLKKNGDLLDFDKRGSEMPYAYWEGGCSFDPEAYKDIWANLLYDANVEILYHTVVIDAITKNSKIDYLEIYNKSGKSFIHADVFIDCSGDGDVIKLSGCSYSVGDEKGICMSPTLAFRLGGVNTEKLFIYLDKNPEEFGNHPRIGKYMQDHRHSSIIQGFYSLINEATEKGDLKISLPEPGIGMSRQPRYGEFHVNATRSPGLNMLDGWDLSCLEKSERNHVKEVFSFIKIYIPGCEDSYILQTAEQVGIRETRRLNGLYIMTMDDLKNGTRFDDCVVRAKWAHCDAHSGNSMQWSFQFIEGPFYIPYRSLLPIEVSNLLVAGRCASTTRDVLSSLRIQPIGAAEGQAAGTAAALALENTVTLKNLDPKLLQLTLNRDGVML